MTPLELEEALAERRSYAEWAADTPQPAPEAMVLTLTLHPGEAAVLAQITGLGMAMMSGDQPTAQALHNLLRDPSVIPAAISAYRKVVGLLVDEEQLDQIESEIDAELEEGDA